MATKKSLDLGYNWGGLSSPVIIPSIPKLDPSGGTKPQSAMTYEELVSRGPGYGSQGARSLPSLPDPGDKPPDNAIIVNSSRLDSPGGVINARGTGNATNATGLPAVKPTDENIYGGNMTGGYTAAGYSDLLYNDPGAVAADFLASMGITNEDAIGLMQPLVEVASLLEAIVQGGTPGYSPTAADLQGFVNDLLTQMSTPNGQALDANAIYDMMMNTDPNSLLGQSMAKMTPDQINNMIMGIATAAIPNPYLQRGVQAQNNANARQYNTSIAKGGSTSGNSYFDQVKGGAYGGYFGGQ